MTASMRKHYRSLFLKHGDSAESAQWSSRETQERRFEVLLQIQGEPLAGTLREDTTFCLSMPIETLSAGSVRDTPEVNSDEYDIGTVSGGGAATRWRWLA